jgi:hypothetical protein
MNVLFHLKCSATQALFLSMKHFLLRVCHVRSAVLTGLLFWSGGCWLEASGQVNSWTNSASSYWEDSHWSLGILPGTNQTVLFTNAGWKALGIGSVTAQQFPQTLTVDSITISSPTNSFNTLFLNYAGLQTPLAANHLIIASNSAVVMYASALHITSELSVGGTFTQDGFSEVTNSQMDIGYGGPAVYNLNSGILVSRDESVGEYFPSQFMQRGGTNLGPVKVHSESEYDLNDGCLETSIWVEPGGTFKLQGGRVNSPDYTAIDGYYFQSGGIFAGGIFTGLPASDRGMSLPANIPVGAGGNGVALQTGGTNEQTSITLGIPTIPVENSYGDAIHDSGTYTLSNGVLVTAGMVIAGNSWMEQAGGTHDINGDLGIHGSLYYVEYVVNEYALADYRLDAGTLSVHDLAVGLGGAVIQFGGTNQVMGALALATASTPIGYRFNGYYELDDGLLMASSISLPAGSTGFFQSGGRVVATNIQLLGATFHHANGSNQVTGDLAIGTFSIPDYYRYRGDQPQSGEFNGSYQMDDGLLMVSNLVVHTEHSPYLSGHPKLGAAKFSQGGGQLLASDIQLIDAAFYQTGGSITQSGLLALDGRTTLQTAGGNQQLGQLRLGVSTNDEYPYLQLPAGPCVLRFADSSSFTWSTQAVLHIGNWSGSPYGGGNQRIIFGTNNAALTGQQLSQILFSDPVGPYHARILVTGEIVPDTGAPLPLAMGRPNPMNGAMQVAIQGEIGRRYAIEVSTNMQHWTWWTNQVDTDGMLFITDCSVTNYPVRFYRAVLLP